MGLNKQKGNMYGFCTHTWNAIKGRCFHNCSYCYMKRWGEQREPYFDIRELKTNLGKNNFIFVGSSCDMFADDIPRMWIEETLKHCLKYDENRYFFQSKNPKGFARGLGYFPEKSILCTTIETNRFIPEIMQNSPSPENRVSYFSQFVIFDKHITIEPIMDFDLEPMEEMIRRCHPVQVNIGADSGNNNLSEPSNDKIVDLICRLKMFTNVIIKDNMKRLWKRDCDHPNATLENGKWICGICGSTIKG